MQSKLCNIKGVKCISDDIIVYGKKHKEHSDSLRILFQRLRENGFKVNSPKCIIGQSSIKFFGVVISNDGIKPDPDKVSCLKNADPPINQGELKSFLGLCTYMSRFIANFSQLTAPLRDLIKKNSVFKWTDQRQLAFEKLKSALTNDSVVSFFNPDKPCKL